MTSENFPPDRIFEREALEITLDSILHRTLGDIDSAGIFDRFTGKNKVTGIAGDVIEQSVLGYEADNRNECDILVDNIPTEVKTTGFRIVGNEKVAKEPMSITAVTPKKIAEEEFYTSHFWEKLAHMLLVYYHYDSKTTVKALEYMHFTVEGYEFHEFSIEERKILRNDWEIVRDFIALLQKDYENPEKEYPRISYELRSELMLIDTAPKWPHPPRFRLKRSFVNEIIQSYFRGKEEETQIDIDKYADIDAHCEALTKKYGGMSIKTLMREFNLGCSKPDKAIEERITVRMFGGEALSMSKVPLFRKIGLWGKSISISSKGGRTEDMKLCTVDFEEITASGMRFEDSSLYEYFSDNQLLCIIFKEKDENKILEENEFVGFKRIAFPEEMIQKEVRPIWEEVRSIVLENKLRKIPVLTKDGKPIMNKNGIQKTKLNFPKSKDRMIFLRGTGSDSSDTPITINGIEIMRQNYWIRGKDIIAMLNLE